ncbi:hypothetical protein [Salinarimonas chemoclinalis]|uniref:hypothetical protein n=1 Tax=Salinarimonas chemoclinalis TaxID=3241599 RepID=UPI0035583945
MIVSARTAPLALALSLACSPAAFAHGDHDHGHDHDTPTAVRAFVADAIDGTVRAFDIESAEQIGTFTMDAPARLHRGATTGTIVASMPTGDAVAFIGTGVSLEDHGDHADLVLEAPTLLPARLTGGRPAHVNRDGSRIAVFFDDDGAAQLIGEAELTEADVAVETISAGVPHHGLAKPVGGLLAISVPAEGERLPVAVSLLGAEGAPLVRAECARLHGEGQSGSVLAFGCADAVAFVDTAASPPRAWRHAYAAEPGGERMVRNIQGAVAFRSFLADFGPDGMVVVDPSAEDGFAFVQLPARRMHFALDADPGDTGWVVVEDGRLLKLNALTGAILGEVAVTDRYTMEQGVVRPRISVAGGHVVVTDPAAGEIVVVDGATMAVERRIAVGGEPGDVVLVSASGAAH